MARLRGRRSASSAASSSGSRAARWARSRPASAGPAQPRGRDGDRRPRHCGPVGGPRSLGRPTPRAAGGPGAAAPAGAGPAAGPTQPGASVGARTTRRAWVLGRDGRRPAAARCAVRAGRSGRRGAGRRPPSAARSRPSNPVTRPRRARRLPRGRRRPEALAAAVLGGVGAGYRLVRARLADGDDDIGGSSNSSRRARRCPPGAADPGQRPARRRCRAARATRTSSPARACSSRRNGSTSDRSRAAEAARTVTEVAVETLRARGEPARYERLLGEILVGLDRAGQLRRLATARPTSESDRGAAPSATAAADPPDADRPAADPVRSARPRPPAARGPVRTGLPDGATGAGRRRPAEPSRRPRRGLRRTRSPRPTRSTRLLALVRDELSRPTNGRLRRSSRVAGGSRDPADREAAAAPLADRVEWAVYSLLSTAGPLSEASFFERIAALFPATTCPTRPRPGLPRELPEHGEHAGPAGHRRRSAPPDASEHAELIAAARGRRAIGSGCTSGSARREQARAHRRRLLGDWLDEREQRAYLGRISRAVDDVADGRLHLVRPRPGGAAVRGRVDGDARRAAPPPPRPDPARRFAGPFPRRRAGADGARPPQARALAAPARGRRDATTGT